MASKGKRMAYGGSVGYGGNKTNDPAGPGGYGGTGNGGVSGGGNAGGGGKGGPAGGVTTGTKTGSSASNRPSPERKKSAGSPPKAATPKSTPKAKAKANKNINIKMQPGTGPGNFWGGGGLYSKINRPASYGGAPGKANPEGKTDREMQDVMRGSKRMAVGGAAGVSDMMYREPGAKTAKMPGRGMPAVEPGGNGMGRPATSPGRGRPSFLGIGRPGRGNVTNYPGIEGPGEGSMGRNPIGAKPPSMGRPTTGGELPPVNDKFLRPGTPKTPAVMSGGGMGASTGLTPVGGGMMAPNMNRDPSAVSAPRTGGAAGPVGMKMGMRGGGLARKGKGQALAKGGLVKGSGCAARGVKKPRYT